MALISKLFSKDWKPTIRTKLTAIFTLLIGVISVFIFTFFPARLENQATEAVIAKAQTIAEMMAYSISPALFFEDSENIENVFKSAKQNKDLVYIVLVDNSGKTVAAFNKDQAEQANFVRAENNNHISEDGMIYNTMTPVLHNNYKVGELYLGLSLKKLRAEIRKSRTTIAFVSLIIFVFGMISVFGIGTVITRPLSQMAKTVERISRGDLTQRAVVCSRDEVGQLATSFNRMVDHLESTYCELENVNRSLEKRVKDRTKELRQEINERRRAEEALRASEQKYRTMIEQSNDMIWTLDTEGNFTYFNKRTEEFSGHRFEDWQGKPFAAFIVEKDLSLAMEVFQKTLNGEPQHYEVRIKKLDGDILILSVNTAPIFKAGAVVGTVNFGRDITERKQLEEQLRQSQKMEAIGRLAGGVAHDFNNILTGIQGYVDLILMELQEDDPLYRDLKEIQRNAARAANLTRQLLLFSRRQPIEMTPLNLNSTIEDMMKMLNRLIGEDISITTKLTEDLWTVNADPGTIEQVLMNLVVNARDAMPEGGKITIKTENVHIDKKYCRIHRYARPGKFVCLSVQDTGIGMEEVVINQVFEPFFSTKKPGKGTGLGLSVVYGIVKKHDGWIDVKSSPGKGAIFKIYLPAISTKPDEKQEASVSLLAVRGSGERILLVEDDEVVRRFTAKGLSENGYRVFVAANVQEALDIFHKHEGDFDLIFSDVVLSDERGPKLVEQLLKLNPEINILLASGYSDEKSDWSVIKKRKYPYLQKPYSLFELLKCVSDVLKKNYCGKKDENSLY